MRRWLGLVVLVSLAGCQTSERFVQPLPPDAPPLSYSDLQFRAKSQVNACHDLFYRNSWKELESACIALQQTGEMLGKVPADQAPAKVREELPKLSKQLQEDATALGQAAKAADVQKTGEAFQRLDLTIRALWTE